MTYPERLLNSFKELSGLVLSRESVASTLTVVANLAVQTIPACDLASVSLVKADEILTVGASDEVAILLDEIQYETGEGPCLDAIGKDAMWFRIDEMTTDTTWPNFSAKAARYGFESLLGLTLRIDHSTLGALNLFAQEASAFATEDVEIGAIYAAHAAVALANAQASPGKTQWDEELDEALLSQELIARAVGILMEKEFRTPDEAFEILEERAERLKIQLRESAREVLLSADRERADLELPKGFARRVMGRARDE